MASSGSDDSDRAAAAAATGSLGSLCNPELANLPAAELVVHLYNNRRGSDFADVAVLLAQRERRLAEAEAQIRRAGEREARLQAEVRAWECRRATEPEALLPADARGPDCTAASVGDQEGVEAQLVGAHASRASEVEVAPLDCTPSAGEAAADLPRLSPLRTTAANALLAPALQRESECNKENKDSGNSGHGHATTVPQGNVCVDDKGKGQAKEVYFADATSVASEHSDDGDWIKHLTESELWEMFNTMKAQVSAWEPELNAADGAAKPTKTSREEMAVDESEAQESSEATDARLQDETIVCECEAEAVIHTASKTKEERLRAEIMECKEKAYATEVGLWAEILARGSAVADLEAWKSFAEKEAERQVRAASMAEARLRDEIAACKRKAAEAEASNRAEMKACNDRAAAAIRDLQDEMSRRDQLAGELRARMEDRIVALDGYHTAIQNGLRINIQAMELTIQYLAGTGPSLSNEDEAMGAQDDSNMMQRRHGDEQGVSGRELHTDPAAAPSSHAQASGQQ